jgi:hypothetical protein
MNPAPRLPQRRSPAVNALIVGVIVLAMAIGGVIIWNSWSRGSRTAVDEAHDAVVQPVEPPATSTGSGQAAAGSSR